MTRASSRTTWVVALALASLALGCSLLNQEGPDVTCEDLQCGKVNTCQEGIIAQCVDGKTVKYLACQIADACEQSWQVEGAYRCAIEETDCEGCRPERSGCDAFATGSGSSSDASTTASASSSDAGSSASGTSSSTGPSSTSGASSGSAGGGM